MVAQFKHLDVFLGIFDTGHFICALCGILERKIRREILVAQEIAIHATAVSGDPHRVLRELLCPLFAAQQHSVSPVGNRIDVHFPKRIRIHRRIQHVFFTDDFIFAAVGVFLPVGSGADHDLRQVFVRHVRFFHVGAGLHRIHIVIVHAERPTVEGIIGQVGNHPAAFPLRFFAVSHEKNHIIMAGEDAGHGVSEAVDAFLSHFFLAAKMRAHNIRDAVVGYRPGVEHVIRTADDRPDALFHVKSDLRLLHDRLKTFEQHVLKTQIMIIWMILDLRHRADSQSLTHYPSSFLLVRIEYFSSFKQMRAVR